MLAAIHTGTTLEFNWLKVLSPFGREAVNIFLNNFLFMVVG